MRCEEDEDCPGEFECSRVYFGCSNDAECGAGRVCVLVETVNEENQQLCGDPVTGMPVEMDRTCSPRSGSCLR